MNKDTQKTNNKKAKTNNIQHKRIQKTETSHPGR
jgi:hypothetical protein